jgi:hypothetical protein
LSNLPAPNKEDNAVSDLPASENDTDADDDIPGLSYRIPPRSLQQLRKSQETVYWSHTLYRNTKGAPIKVSYASNLLESEELAKRFLKEEVLGFDSECATVSFGDIR